MMSEFEEASESNNIISLGSPPGEDALEWAQTSEESAEDMPISFKVRSICELVQLALERDFASDATCPGDNVADPTCFSAVAAGVVGEAIVSDVAELVNQVCVEAMRADRYCLYVNEQVGGGMTCQKPEGGLGIATNPIECIEHNDCNGVKTPLHDTCEANTCVIKYERVVDVALVLAEGYGKNRCDIQSMEDQGSKAPDEGAVQITWEDIPVQSDSGQGGPREHENEIKGSNNKKMARLCLKKSSYSVQDDDESTWGVCHVLISRDTKCGDVGPTGGITSWHPFLQGAEESDNQNHGMPDTGAGRANINSQGSGNGGGLYLCYTKYGCEGRPGQNSGASTAVSSAIAQLNMNRHDHAHKPNALPDGIRVWDTNGANGDLNQVSNRGGKVYLFYGRAS